MWFIIWITYIIKWINLKSEFCLYKMVINEVVIEVYKVVNEIHVEKKWLTRFIFMINSWLTYLYDEQCMCHHIGF